MWDSDERKAAAKSDDAVALAAKAELLPALARTEQLSSRIKAMTDKAKEPDPDLQTYGPVMKAKVLALGQACVSLLATAAALHAAYLDSVQAAALRSDQQGRNRAEEEEAARRREEEEEARREREAKAAADKARAEAEAEREREAAVAREREAELTAKMEAAEELDRKSVV